MVAIRSVEEIASKWATVTPQRAGDFKRGVEQPKASWKAGAAAANDAWKEGTAKAIAENRFAKGVAASSDEIWQKATLEKGVNRWGQGVQLGQDKFARGFAPYQAALAGLVLPPRFARRDPRNLERVRAVTEAMSRVKESRGS